MPSFARALITGGLGFIGSNLARRLLADGTAVTVIDCLHPRSGGLDSNLALTPDPGPALTLQRVDLNHVPLNELAGWVAQADVVFHLAGLTSHADSLSEPLTDLANNLAASVAVLEACRRSPRVPVVFSSTRQVYGSPQQLPVRESHPLNPPDVNAVHKLAAEWHHQLYARLYGLRVAILRLTNTYGPRMHTATGRLMFLGAWFKAVRDGRPFEVWGGAQRRDFSYVDDTVEALLRAGEIGATNPVGRVEVFNVGGGPSWSLLELAELLTAVVPQARFELKPMPAARQAIEIGDYVADDSALRRRTGWAPRVDLPTGLRRTWDFLRSN